MSIASEITRLYGVRSDIFTSISNKGVTVPSGSQLDDAPTLIDSISAGGGGGAYTLDYTNPNQYCTFGSKPNCARSGTTITPVYTLTNNYVLDNLTLNGNNIQGNSFSMPAIDSIVGMVVHQIQPIKLRIAFDTWNEIKLYNLRYNGNVPTFLGGIYHWGIGNTDVELSTSDLNAMCNQYTPYSITGRGVGSYIELSLNFTSFDTSSDYFTWSHNWMYSNIDFTATVRSGNSVLVTETYNYPGNGSQLDVRIPAVTYRQCYNCSNNTLNETTHICSSCGTQFSECPECGEYAVYEQPTGYGHEEYDEQGEPYYVDDYGNACGACGWHDWEDAPTGDNCPNCGEPWDGVSCGNCGYPDNEDPGDDPGPGGGIGGGEMG